jgi:hypothetical protein
MSVYVIASLTTVDAHALLDANQPLNRMAVVVVSFRLKGH